MLDIACPIGPSVELASDDELENHIRSVYGRSTQQIVHFNEIVKKSFSIQETEQRVKGPIEPNSIHDRYIIGAAVWMGAMYGREQWEEEYPDQSLVFYDKVRREKDSISTQKIQNQLVALAEAKGITLRNLMGKIINIVEDTKDFTFAQFDKMYFTDMDDEDS